MKPEKTNCKILIVDSSLLIIDRVNNLLTEMCNSYTVSKASNYSEALEKLSTDKYDFVLLDTQLQGKSGFELLSFIKSNYPDTKTIILTNQVSEFYRNKGEEIGTDYFMDKSGEFEKIVAIIRNNSLEYEIN